MAVTVSDFTTRYPEFEDVETDTPGLIQARLDEAQRWHDASLLSEAEYDDLVYLFVAWHLVDTPFGSPMGLTTDTNAQEVNRYRELYKQRLFRIPRRAQLSGGGLT